MIPDQLADKVSKKNIPVSASFELTWRCNLKCVHCYQYPPGNNELATNEVKDILDQLQDAGCLYLSFTGGEPLVRKDFWEIAEYARSKTFAITLQTNGTLITPALAHRLHKLNFFSVHISLLGATVKTHDTITREKGSFQRAITAIKDLKAERVNVVLKITLMKQNFAEFEQINHLAEKLGVDKVFSPVIYPRSDGGRAPLKFRLDDKDLREFYSSIFKKDPSQKEPFESEGVSPLCQFGRTDCCINSQGKLYPCAGVPLVLDDLKEKRFSEIWSNSETLQKIRRTTLQDLRECATCDIRSLCIRCSGLSLLEEKDLFAPSQECCRMTRIIKEVITNEKEEIPEA